MKTRIIIGIAILVGMFGASTVATRGDGVGPSKRWAIVNFVSPVRLGDQYLMGHYLIVHDDVKMARGEACTSIYRFDPKTGPKEEILVFHCQPAERAVCDKTTITLKDRGLDIPVFLEYQFAGDTEGHGVPTE